MASIKYKPTLVLGMELSRLPNIFRMLDMARGFDLTWTKKMKAQGAEFAGLPIPEWIVKNALRTYDYTSEMTVERSLWMQEHTLPWERAVGRKFITPAPSSGTMLEAVSDFIKITIPRLRAHPTLQVRVLLLDREALDGSDSVVREMYHKFVRGLARYAVGAGKESVRSLTYEVVAVRPWGVLEEDLPHVEELKACETLGWDVANSTEMRLHGRRQVGISDRNFAV
ncbi:hypothetical protein K458DRAFT_422162 [Lentithecium fluviatile CBS 122367]|uniref:Uncharacterized protein n=1 Tax=Lentithecium fluviatile CBS 122367 TaxID=1168545 RepID=A0A6G1IP10_9PLEO|nr:hypothetical protein K458DRAFT_422162 [Lentithecium fluviatile CBS 122367]